MLPAPLGAWSFHPFPLPDGGEGGVRGKSGAMGKNDALL
jgi:hypothetical protein